MPQMGHDTKTDRLADCQSQCDFDFDETVTLSQYSVGYFLRVRGSIPAGANKLSYSAEYQNLL
jgi:hypothetical protein